MVKSSVRAKGNRQQIIKGLCIICQFVFKIIFIIASALISFRDNIPSLTDVCNCGKAISAFTGGVSRRLRQGSGKWQKVAKKPNFFCSLSEQSHENSCKVVHVVLVFSPMMKYILKGHGWCHFAEK